MFDLKNTEVVFFFNLKVSTYIVYIGSVYQRNSKNCM